MTIHPAICSPKSHAKKQHQCMYIHYVAKGEILSSLFLGRIHLPLNKTLMDNTSVKWSVFHLILMKLGEVVVPMCTTTSPSFIKIA